MASELGEKITLTCREDDTQVSRSLEYAVYTYIYKNQDTTDTRVRDMVRAIFNYGESAKKV